MSFAFTLIQTTIKEWLAYRASMLLTMITGPLVFLVNVIIWNAIFSASEASALGGLTLAQIITYYAVGAVTFTMIWCHTDEDLSNTIRDGQMLTNLIKPMSIWQYFWFYKIGHRSLAFVLEVIPQFFVLVLLAGIDVFKTSSIGLYLAALVIAFFLFFIIRFIIGLLSFWMIDNHGIRHLTRAFMIIASGMVIPLSFFPQIIQKILFFLPFQFLAYVPAQAFIGTYSIAGMNIHPMYIIWVGLLHCLFWASVSAVLWRLALRKFHGVGA